MEQLGLDRQEEQLVVFQLDGQHYGLDIGLVQEIINWQPVTKMPQSAPFLEGIINLRGRITPVMNLRTRFGLRSCETKDHGCILVVKLEEVIGLMVDGVSEVLRVRLDQIEPAAANLGDGGDYVRGIAKTPDGLIILLRPESLRWAGDAS